MRCFVTGICYQTLTFDCDECGGVGVGVAHSGSGDITDGDPGGLW